jgi:hypothetical protein
MDGNGVTQTPFRRHVQAGVNSFDTNCRGFAGWLEPSVRIACCAAIPRSHSGSYCTTSSLTLAMPAPTIPSALAADCETSTTRPAT